MTDTITQALVIEKSAELPGFPRVIAEILALMDNPEANINDLTNLIQHDPVITARVLAQANNAAARSQSRNGVRDIYTAASLIGMGRVRHMAIISSSVDYLGKIAPPGISTTFWQHSVAVAVCCEEVALHISRPISVGAALIAGLLHDVGQLWLYRFSPNDFRAAWDEALAHATGIEEAEREHFGIDHSQIGAWLAEYWGLPSAIVAAIAHHHACDQALDQPLVPVLHIAEVLSNALDLTGRAENRVTHLSAAACTALGIVWNAEIRGLFGRIEARSRHANMFFA